MTVFHIDYYILTGNSIVDQSELILQGIPTFIYYAGYHRKKYKKFYEGVIADGCAKALTDKDTSITGFKPVPLNDNDKLVDEIKKMANL